MWLLVSQEINSPQKSLYKLLHLMTTQQLFLVQYFIPLQISTWWSNRHLNQIQTTKQSLQNVFFPCGLLSKWQDIHSVAQDPILGIRPDASPACPQLICRPVPWVLFSTTNILTPHAASTTSILPLAPVPAVGCSLYSSHSVLSKLNLLPATPASAP